MLANASSANRAGGSPARCALGRTSAEGGEGGGSAGRPGSVATGGDDGALDADGSTSALSSVGAGPSGGKADREKERRRIDRHRAGGSEEDAMLLARSGLHPHVEPDPGLDRGHLDASRHAAPFVEREETRDPLSRARRAAGFGDPREPRIRLGTKWHTPPCAEDSGKQEQTA